MTEISLRQRKKNRTRATLIEVSERLFSEQGYGATTLEQIASAAEISVPTLLVYFESKERLALAPDFDLLEEFRRSVDDPERAEDTVTLWRRHIEHGSAEVHKDIKGYLVHTRYLGEPALGRGVLELLMAYEDVLAEGIAKDYGTDPETDLATRLLASTLTFGNHSVVRRWASSGGSRNLGALTLAVVDFADKEFPKPGKKRRGR